MTDATGNLRSPRQPVRDAATLILLDESEGPARVLVGRRSAGHVFMAGRIVFPGGRVDPGDVHLARRFTMPEASRARLTSAVAGRFAERRATALALAAIRETFEETGLLLGRRDEGFATPFSGWAPFTAAGIAPDPAVLIPVARAITPPGQVRRFDTRFFAAPASAIAPGTAMAPTASDEFETVAWMSLDELRACDLAPITREIVDHVADRLAQATLFDAKKPMPLIRRRPDGGFDRLLI